MKKVVTNPYLPNFEYVPDGEPHVFNGRVYVYGSHDRFGSSGFCLNNYITWSAPVDDLSDWRYEGVIWKKTDDPLNKTKTQFYAPDVCQGPDGKYYIYYSPAPGITKGSWVIRCAVADNPAGPFKFHGKVDLSKWQKNYAPFDPAVYVENGHVYLYYGSALFYPVIGLSAKNILGGAVVELDPKDMLTVISGPILTVPSIQNDVNKEYGIHAFFEASSMRKFKDKYYFIYSSQAGHELFYCIGDSPIGPFKKGGTLVSNGDIGLRGITNSKDACDFTGNTHGSMVEVNGHYYVFAHRQTNKCQFSRQGFAEEIFMEPDGSFKQVERTSQGLYGKPLPGKGEYFASICCGLRAKNGNRFYGIFKSGHNKEPFLTQRGKDRDENPNQYVKNFNDGCSVTYKYFDLKETKCFGIEVDGTAKGKLIMKYGDKEAVQEINLQKENKVIEFPIENGGEKDQVTFIYEGKGAIDLIKLILK